jgi:hypothetical protein
VSQYYNLSGVSASGSSNQRTSQSSLGPGGRTL